MNEKPKNTESQHTSFSRLEWFGLICVFLAVIVMWFLSPWIVRWISGLAYHERAELGQFGDSYAVTNTLFSGLAFVGLVATLFFQRRDLMSQVDALRQQVNEFEEQNKLTSQQMAFQELQALIKALPTLRLTSEFTGPEYRDPADNQLKMRPQTQHFELHNFGADIYDVKMTVTGFPNALMAISSLPTKGKLNHRFDVGDKEARHAQLSYVSHLGEQRRIGFKIDHDFIIINNFADDAKRLRREVYERFQLLDPTPPPETGR